MTTLLGRPRAAGDVEADPVDRHPALGDGAAGDHLGGGVGAALVARAPAGPDGSTPPARPAPRGRGRSRAAASASAGTAQPVGRTPSNRSLRSRSAAAPRVHVLADRPHGGERGLDVELGPGQGLRRDRRRAHGRAGRSWRSPAQFRSSGGAPPPPAGPVPIMWRDLHHRPPLGGAGQRGGHLGARRLGVVVVVCAGLAAALNRWGRLGHARDDLVAAARATVQLTVVGLVIAAVLRSWPLTLAFIAVMLTVASVTAGRRLVRGGPWWWAFAPVLAAAVPVSAGLVSAGWCPTGPSRWCPSSGSSSAGR